MVWLTLVLISLVLLSLVLFLLVCFLLIQMLLARLLLKAHQTIIFLDSKLLQKVLVTLGLSASLGRLVAALAKTYLSEDLFI